jgi:hypothetical protein
MPTSRPDPVGDKARALRFVGRFAAKTDEAIADRNAAVLFASESGASLREIEAASGIPFNTVKRIIDRQRARS